MNIIILVYRLVLYKLKIVLSIARANGLLNWSMFSLVIPQTHLSTKNPFNE